MQRWSDFFRRGFSKRLYTAQQNAKKIIGDDKEKRKTPRLPFGEKTIAIGISVIFTFRCDCLVRLLPLRAIRCLVRSLALHFYHRLTQSHCVVHARTKWISEKLGTQAHTFIAIATVYVCSPDCCVFQWNFFVKRIGTSKHVGCVCNCSCSRHYSSRTKSERIALRGRGRGVGGVRTLLLCQNLSYNIKHNLLQIEFLVRNPIEN